MERKQPTKVSQSLDERRRERTVSWFLWLGVILFLVGGSLSLLPVWETRRAMEGELQQLEEVLRSQMEKIRRQPQMAEEPELRKSAPLSQPGEEALRKAEVAPRSQAEAERSRPKAARRSRPEKRRRPAQQQEPQLIEEELRAEERRRLTEQQWTADHIKQLKEAQVAFNQPEVMYIARRTQVTVALAPSTQQAIETLKKTFERDVEGKVRTDTAKASTYMMAKLHGKDFEIRAASPEEKMVLETEPTEWTWYVEPLDFGHGKLLRIELFAILSRAGGRSPPLTVRTFEARINVNNLLWDRVITQARALQPVFVSLSGLGGLGALWALYLKMVRCLHRRQLRLGSKSQ